jgi:XTP/dITP diphosphohydrolase
MKKLLIATTNAGKRDEYRVLLASLPYEVISLADVGLDGMDVDETGETFFENALLKARAYQQASGLVTLADDSGIAVDALDGAPGVYSARYAPTVAERNAKLLAALQHTPIAQRSARFVAIIAVATDNGIIITGEGTVEGMIAPAPRGRFGHGYDPVFELPDGRTMAELPPDEKNAISHRGRALAKIYPLLACLGEQP